MKITIVMEMGEFEDFCAWRKDKKQYDRDIEEVTGAHELMAKKVLWAVEENPKKPGHYKIADQDHLDELVDMANEFFT